jgi:regulatory protein
MARQALSLKARAIGLLAQREHSRAELRRKLLRIERARVQPGEHPDDEPPDFEAAVEALLDSLAADGYLSEARFVESRLNLRASRFGAQRIQQELAQHGLRLDAEQQAALRASELVRAREVRARRFGPEAPADLPEQARQTRFLLARGFAADVVRKALRPAD